MAFSREKHLKKIGFKKGYVPWNKGKHTGVTGFYGRKHTQESKDKMSGDQNKNWRGNEAGIHSIHTWVRTRLGTPKKCSSCGTTTARFFDWANIDHKYKRVLSDWIRLCRKCHIHYDMEHNGLKPGRKKL